MKPHVLIVGGGIAGPALALFLNRVGISSAISEAYPQQNDIGGGIQIAPNGMHVLEHIGIAGQIMAHGVESDEFSLENQHGRVLGIVPNGPANLYRFPAITVSRSVLHRALTDEVNRLGIPIAYKKRLQAFTSSDSGVVAEFQDGSLDHGTLLIGADGVQSRTRELLFPQGQPPFYTGLFTVGGFARHPSLTPAIQEDMCRMHMIFGREGFFGYGYFDRHNPDNVMWWSHVSRDCDPHAQDYKSWPNDELRNELLARHHGWPEPIETILRNAPDLLRGPVYDVPTLPTWSKERVLLIGDAAHATSPHAGQGASLALEDAMTLARIMRKSEAKHEVVFAQFIKERRGRVERIVAEARRRGDRKQTLTPTAAWIRDQAISIMARLMGARMNKWIYSYNAEWDS